MVDGWLQDGMVQLLILPDYESGAKISATSVKFDQAREGPRERSFD